MINTVGGVALRIALASSKVVAVDTAGHTRGHVSVICIDDAGRHVMLAGASAAHWGAALNLGGLRAGAHAKPPRVAAVAPAALSPPTSAPVAAPSASS